MKAIAGWIAFAVSAIGSYISSIRGKKVGIITHNKNRRIVQAYDPFLAAIYYGIDNIIVYVSKQELLAFTMYLDREEITYRIEGE